MAVLDQYQTTSHTNTLAVQIRATVYGAQTFQAGASGNLTSIKLWMNKFGSPVNLMVEIQGISDSKPDGNVLASEEISSGDITTDGNEITITFSSPYTVTSGTSYCILIHQKEDGGDTSNYYYQWGDQSHNYYANGSSYYSTNSGSSWTIQTNYDAYFETYVEDPTIHLGLSDTITLSDLIDYKEAINEDTITLSDEIELDVSLEKLSLADTIILGDIVQGIHNANYANRILCSGTDLVIVCNESPAKVVKIDISGATPTWEVFTLDAVGEIYAYANDLCINETFNKVYVGCNSGKIAKITFADFDAREEIDTEDTDNLINLECVDDINLTFAGTDNSVGELIKIDESTITKLNTKFTFLRQFTKKINTYFAFIKGVLLNTKFTFCKTVETLIHTDFRFSPYLYADVAPKARSDFKVEIDSVETTDVDLSSISVNWVMDDESTASFVLARNHDRLDYDAIGEVVSEITEKNAVVIYFNNVEIFTGKIETLDCSGESDKVTVHCKGAERHKDFRTIELTLPTLNEQRHLYHIVNDNITIINPVTDYDDDDNKTHYRGIKINEGNREWENVSRWILFGSVPIDEWDDFVPKQNWTYFWVASMESYFHPDTGFGSWYRVHNQYLGTSLSSLGSNLWFNVLVQWYKQRISENEVQEIGYYTLGSAPYREISVDKTGVYNAKPKWVDKEDGLYVERGDCWDYTGYAREVANVEYHKMLDVNSIAPNNPNFRETNATIDITIDALLYYGIKISTKINIVNTTEAEIYKDNNGFPLRIREININSGSMLTSLVMDNIPTQSELAIIDTDYPEEPSYYNGQILEGYSKKVLQKFDPMTDKEVE